MATILNGFKTEEEIKMAIDSFLMGDPMHIPIDIIKKGRQQ